MTLAPLKTQIPIFPAGHQARDKSKQAASRAEDGADTVDDVLCRTSSLHDNGETTMTWFIVTDNTTPGVT